MNQPGMTLALMENFLEAVFLAATLLAAKFDLHTIGLGDPFDSGADFISGGLGEASQKGGFVGLAANCSCLGQRGALGESPQLQLFFR